MENEKESPVLITREACDYLRISRPTYIKYLSAGRIKATKAGNGWRVLKSELDRFLKAEKEDWIIPKSHTEDHTGNLIQKGH
jgi:excisionase family DNA binding protein